MRALPLHGLRVESRERRRLRLRRVMEGRRRTARKTEWFLDAGRIRGRRRLIARPASAHGSSEAYVPLARTSEVHAARHTVKPTYTKKQGEIFSNIICIL